MSSIRLARSIPVELLSNIPKIELAFAPGYDPALELASHVKDDGRNHTNVLDHDWPQHMIRDEQQLVDKIVNGEETGKYFVIIGPKVGPLLSVQVMPKLITQTGLGQRDDDIGRDVQDRREWSCLLRSSSRSRGFPAANWQSIKFRV
jgi:hypothetical protein